VVYVAGITDTGIRVTKRKLPGTKLKTGAKSTYKSEYAEQAEKLCMLGATDEETADFFHTTTQTVHAWRKTQPAFLDATIRGKLAADANVAKALYKRATGYSHPAVKFFYDAKSGTTVRADYTQHYPPDTAACSLWLRNRQPRFWRDKQDLEVAGRDGGPLQVTVINYVPPKPAVAMNDMPKALPKPAADGYSTKH
jgi:hypothetical protein